MRTIEQLAGGRGSRPMETAAHRGRLRLRIGDGWDGRELPIFADLREALVPRLARRLHRLGHVVPDLDLPSHARPFPGSSFAWAVATAAGEQLTIHCELRPRPLWRSRVGSVRYEVVAGRSVTPPPAAP